MLVQTQSRCQFAQARQVGFRIAHFYPGQPAQGTESSQQLVMTPDGSVDGIIVVQITTRGYQDLRTEDVNSYVKTDETDEQGRVIYTERR